ncbi:NB-ARC domain-containing protein [Piscinibacter sp. XHJ-5]|uniref:NB-ARC domain-containing protein n=1 Tax=Piscinibacter sp. XHJ-5 TaxID=3037797 RepID=UPI00245307D4|nr:NB-ARC domain-containing protein [Piscinibacter sp. XHJ-5]
MDTLGSPRLTGRATRPQVRGASPRLGVFISYARVDGTQLAERLRQAFMDAGLSVWQDIPEIEVGDDWWLQIRQALDRVEYLVLVMTEGALASEVVRRECQYARQQGVAVCPVTAGTMQFAGAVPRWLRSLHWHAGENLQRLIAELNRSPKVRRVPFMAEAVPVDYVHRTTEYEQLVRLLIEPQRHEPVAITAALRGAGGYGKTTLARAICHDPRVLEVFDDGVVWITLGERPGSADLLDRVVDLIETLDGERPGFAGLDAAAARLRQSLADRRLLFVIDDVWHAEHLAPFLKGGPQCSRLITTRDGDTLPPDAGRIAVDQMKSKEAMALLAQGLPALHPSHLRTLAERLGEWPLLLKLANGVLRRRIVEAAQPPDEALAWVEEALATRGVFAFDARNAEDRNRAVARTVQLSLDGLSASETERFFDLAVFPEDLDIPLLELGRYWHLRGRLRPFEVEDFCLRLHTVSLLQQVNLETRTVRLHDAIRHFLLDAHDSAVLMSRHGALVDALGEGRPAEQAALSNEYLLRHLAYHLAAAGRLDELVRVLKSVDFATARIHRHRSWSLRQDLALAAELVVSDPLLRAIEREVGRSAHVLDEVRDVRELTQTLRCRLAPFAMEDEGDGASSGPALLAQYPLPALHPDLMFELRLDAGVRSLAFNVDGERLLCGTRAGWAQVVEMRTGRPLARFSGQGGKMNACMFMPDDRTAVSVGDDGTPAIWDMATGAKTTDLEACGCRLLCCDIDPSGTWLAAGGADNRLHLWELCTGRRLHALKGHAASIVACNFAADGTSVVTAAADGHWRMFNLSDFSCALVVPAHALPIATGTLAYGGHRFVTGAADGRLRLWDWPGGALIADLAAHPRGVQCSAAARHKPWLISGGHDGALRIWNSDTGSLQKTIDTDARFVSAVAVDPHARHFAAAGGSAIRVWQLGEHDDDQPQHRQRHGRIVASAPDGAHLVTSDANHALSVWHGDPARQHRLEPALEGPLACVCVSPDGRYVAAAPDNGPLRVWQADVQRPCPVLLVPASSPDAEGAGVLWCTFADRGEALRWQTSDGRLHAHRIDHGAVTTSPQIEPLVDAMLARDGAWLAGVERRFDDVDPTICMVDAATGQVFASFTADESAGPRQVALAGHVGPVTRCAFSREGRTLISASDDGSAILWDCETGLRRATFGGHGHFVSGALHVPEGPHVFTASWNGTWSRWRAEDGVRDFCIEGHAAPIVDLALAAGASVLLTASSDRSVALWKPDGTLIRRLPDHPAAVTCGALNEAGTLAASGDADGNVTLWDTRSGVPLATWRQHEQQVNRCTFDASARWLATGSDDGTTCIWDVETHRLHRRLKSSSRPVVDVAFHPDGKRVAALSWEPGIDVWDIHSGLLQSRAGLKEWPKLVQCCALSPDGETLAVATGHAMRILRFKDLEPIAMVPRMLHVAGVSVQRKLVGVRVGDSSAWFRVPAPDYAGTDGQVIWARCAVTADRRSGLHWTQEDSSNTCRVWSTQHGEFVLNWPGPEDRPLSCSLSGDGLFAAFVFESGVLRVVDLRGRCWVASLHSGDKLDACCWLKGRERLVASGTLGLHWLRWTG